MKKNLLFLLVLILFGFGNINAEEGTITIVSLPTNFEAATTQTVEIQYTSDVDCIMEVTIWRTDGTSAVDWSTWTGSYTTDVTAATTATTQTLSIDIPEYMTPSSELPQGISYTWRVQLRTAAWANVADSNGSEDHKFVVSDPTQAYNRVEYTSTPPATIELGQEITIDFGYTSSADNGIVQISLEAYNTSTYQGLSTPTPVQNDIKNLATTMSLVQGNSLTITVPSDFPTSAELPEGQAYRFSLYFFAGEWNYVLGRQVNVEVNVATAIDQVNTDGLHVYPNPAKDILTIEGIEIGQIVNLYSVTGALVKTLSVSSSPAQISVTDLAKGLYIVKTSDATVKFIKQ